MRVPLPVCLVMMSDVDALNVGPVQ